MHVWVDVGVWLCACILYEVLAVISATYVHIYAKGQTSEQSWFVLSPSLPLSPGEGCAETPPRVGSCLAEEDLLTHSEEAVRPGLVHEETHNEGKCAPHRSSGEWCSSVWIRTSHPSPSLSPHPLYHRSPLTLLPHHHPSPYTLTGGPYTMWCDVRSRHRHT